MNLVVWGLGKHAINKILPAVQKSNEFSLYGVCSRNIDVLEKIKKIHKINVWTSPSEMFEDKKINAIYLSTPPALHAEQAIKIIDNDIHLLCEKPLTMSFEETSLLINKADTRNLAIMEGLMYLYHPHHQAIRDLFYGKKLGIIKEVKSSFQLPPLDLPGYRKDIKLGASAIYDLGIYPSSLILDLFDYSQIKIIEKELTYDKNLNYDITGKVQLRINNKIDCYIDWAYDTAYLNELSIFGENLCLHSEFVFSKNFNHRANVSLFNNEEIVENISIEEADHFELMLKSFSDLIRGHQDNLLRNKSMLDLSNFLNKLAK